MRTPKGLLIVFLVFAWVPGGVARAQHEHVMQNEKDVKWIDAPPFIPPGAKLALLQGNPAEKGLFSVRLKFPPTTKSPRIGTRR